MSARRPTPLDGVGEVGRRRLLLLGALGALKALGLVLVADGIATGVVTVIAHGDVAAAVVEGMAGALLRALSVWGLRVVSQSAAADVKGDLRIRLAAASLRRLGGNVGADATLAATGLDDLDAYYTSYLPSLVSAATVPLLVGVRILAADWVSALVIVVTMPLIPLFMALIGMHTRDRVAASVDALGRLSDHLVELARGLPVLVGLGREREQTRALAEISDDHRRTSMTALRTAFLSALALDLLATISVAVVAVIIGIRLLHGQLTLEAGLVALILAPECYAPVREIGASFHASDTGREALRRVRSVIDRMPSPHRLVRHDSHSVTVRNLTVVHGGRTAPAVSHLSFDAPRNGITLLAGDSGAGKSTVLAVLAGRGAALDDGAICTGRMAMPPVERIAWMPQHPHFSSPTVRDELALYGTTHLHGATHLHGDGDPHGGDLPGSPEASASTAAATDARSLLARVGLETLAAEHPASLSPGEARRLAFARVLAAVDAGARLVLLDEPTEHLDPLSAAVIRRELAGLRGRATVVLASHDSAVRLLADRVVSVVDGGARPRVSPDAAISPAAKDAEGAPAIPREPAPIAGSARSSHAAERMAVSGRAEAGPGVRLDQSDAQPATAAIESTRSALRELAAFLRPVRTRMVAAVLVGVLSSGFAIALTAVSGWLIVRASQGPAIMYLLVAIVGVRFFGIGRSVLRYAERLLTHDAVFRAVTALRVRLWRALAAAGPAGRTALSPANALTALVGAADRVRDLVPRVIQPPAAALVVLASTAITLGLLYPPAAVVAIALAVVALLIAPTLAIAAGRTSARRGETARAAVLGSFTDLLVARDDLTPRAVDRLLRRIGSADARAAVSERATARVEGAASALVMLACCAAAVAMLPLAAGAVASGSLRPELVAVLALVPLGLIEPLLDAVAAATRAPALLGVLAEVRGVTGIVPGVPDDEDDSVDDRSVRTDEVHGLRLEGVSYRYPASILPAFSDVSGEVARGEWLAVTGPSGSGKSTLLSLLLRFADPESGRYTLRQGMHSIGDVVTDGDANVETGGTNSRDLNSRDTDARTLPPHLLRSRVAWCPQEGHLFDSTLRANLAIARTRTDRPTDAELTDALTRVGLGPLLASLPDGLDTRIGAAGERLSGGQRQRVAVARTLLTRGDVVLVDEPTAHLDEQASARLMADLRVALQDRVTVLVTHDVVEARAADHIIVLGGADILVRESVDARHVSHAA